MTAIKFSLARKEQPIELEVDENTVLAYKIKEMTGADRDRYYNTLTKKTVQDNSGQTTKILDYSGVYSLLLSYTLFDADDQLVKESIIQSWPDSVQQSLHEIARKINNMDKKPDSDEGGEKN